MPLPNSYNRRLARFDPELRVRWSLRRRLWLLERRARYRRLPVDPRRYGYGEHDTVVQMREGYFALGEYQPRDLPTVDRLIAYLRREDARRLGDQDYQALANAIADELDAADEAREERLRQQALGDVAAASGEQWDSDRWRHGLRVAVPRALPRIAAAR